MIELQYFNGVTWERVSTWHNDFLAWSSLGGDNRNYRTIDENKKVISYKNDSKPSAKKYEPNNKKVIIETNPKIILVKK